MVVLLLKDRKVSFKLDMGIEVTAILEEVYKTLDGVKLQASQEPLYGPAHQALMVLGQFTVMLVHKQLSSTQHLCCAWT